MKTITIKLLFGACFASLSPLSAQIVDRAKYPDYTDKRNPDYALMQRHTLGVRNAMSARPDHVNNAETRFFPPVFNQDGGSCGSASRIGYMFSYEMNAFRNLDGTNPQNYYPTHFVWLLTNGNSGKDAFVQHVGVPSAETYGGQTYSKLFGNQEETQNDFGWMTGYDKWYEAMFNRMLKPANFPESTGTDAGREALKNWLWNHNGDESFQSGGLAGVGVAAGTMTCKAIDSTPTNDKLGVTGMKCVEKWGTGVDHALTIVGYDDRIEFDINGNGIYGEETADERGAWILVNSWGNEWQNGGFVYCPYAYGGSHFNKDGSFSNHWWYPEIYKVRKNYKPQRTIKLKMDYTRRSELYLMAGVSADLKATNPDKTQALDHFKYAGDGNNGNTVPAPEIPMLGRWVDGKLHTEPMEFGYDLTDLSDGYDANEPLKYFFIINTKSTAEGSGHIYDASIIDYVQDSLGLEIPFDIDANGVNIQNKGKQTIISLIVPGRGVAAPQNVAVDGGVLKWMSPKKANLSLTGYEIIHEGEIVSTPDADAESYALPEGASGTYGIRAVYGNKRSNAVNVNVYASTANNKCIKLLHSGLTLPGVFDSKYNKATIEFWIRPLSIADWNQSAGPGWGTFMFHANANGSFTAGWDTNNRLNVPSALSLNKWSHIALVVNDSVMTAYVNGTKMASVTSNSYCGIGGFGDLIFSSEDENSDQNAMYDELRIWKTARTADEIKADYKLRYADALLPNDLVAYYPGDVVTINGTRLLCDHTGRAHHGSFPNDNFAVNDGYAQTLKYTANTFVHINQPEADAVEGQYLTLHATGSTNISSLRWTVPGAGIENLVCTSPTISFGKSGAQNVKVVAVDVNGNETEADTLITVLPAPEASAVFKMSKNKVVCGERVTFIPQNMVDGQSYHWTLEGASVETSNQSCVTVSYAKSGTYDVTLNVTAANGSTAKYTQKINIVESAPKAAFDVEPSVVVKGNQVRLTDKSQYGSAHSVWTLSSANNAMQGEGEKLCFIPDVAGVYNVTLTASNDAGNSSASQSRALIVCNADSKTGLNFMPAAKARVELTKVPLSAGQKKFAIDWWQRANTLTDVCNGIGENTQSLQLQTLPDGQMRFYMAGMCASSTTSYVIPNEWHHYAVSFESGKVRFLRDGALVSSAAIKNAKVPAMNSFALGCEEAPMSGMVDEFRVWNGVAFDTSKLRKLHTYLIEPMSDAAVKAAEADGLSVYYHFDQNGGNVVDATANQNTGVRVGFGPDGDAWSSSKGVFAINFDDKSTDVSSSYLSNYEAPFSNTGKVYNDTANKRFMTLYGWKENGDATSSKRTGAHVDTQKDNAFTITTGWDGFSRQLNDHKAYQTVSLPAGVYDFTAKYGSFEGEADGCYLVAAKSDTLPSTIDIIEADGNANSGFVASAMRAKSQTTLNTVRFILTEPSTVSLGILANMQGDRCMTIDSFELTQYPLTIIKGVADGIDDAQISDTLHDGTAAYDLSGRRVFNPQKGIYIVNGCKLIKN